MIVVAVYFYKNDFYHDRECTTLVNGPLYLLDNDYYLDSQCSYPVQIVQLEQGIGFTKFYMLHFCIAFIVVTT